MTMGPHATHRTHIVRGFRTCSKEGKYASNRLNVVILIDVSMPGPIRLPNSLRLNSVQWPSQLAGFHRLSHAMASLLLNLSTAAKAPSGASLN